MAIEAPLRELGVQEVFQLLDLSRKTGILRVTSETGAPEGYVYFEKGRVVHAGIRGQPSSVAELLLSSGRASALDLEHARRFAGSGNGATLLDVLVRAGGVSSRAVERLLCAHVESVVFELMTWRDGFTSFEEKPLSDLASEDRVSLRAESLLMESARRVDEWSHIVDRVPDLSAIPMLSPDAADESTPLDLLPDEWEVLGLVDGERDLRTIANTLMQPASDVAKVLHSLIGSGVAQIRGDGDHVR